MIRRRPASESELPPLIVDLDGTLVLGETSWRALGLSLRKQPGKTVGACFAFLLGMAAGKHAIATIARPQVAKLPYRQPLVKYLERERSTGRKIHLVSGADERIVDEVAAHLGLFDSARGSNGYSNLKGVEKLAFLDARFPGGFDYIGDSAADLPIWRAIGRAMLVGRAINFAPRLREEGVHILQSL